MPNAVKPCIEEIECRSIPEPNTGCWLWLKGVNGKGYGQLRMVGFTTRQAHRLSFSLFYGEEPKPHQLVCHKCDTPLCVNPAHLFLGTDADNMRDMVNKGRHYKQKNGGCPAGHEFTHLGDSGQRRCRICDRASSRRHYARKVA